MKTDLQEYHYSLIFCPTMEGLFKQLEKERAGVILVDQDIDGQQGLDYCLKMEGSIYKDIPRFIMTGKVDKQLVAQMVRSGVKQILLKPLDLKLLAMRLNDVAELKVQRDEHAPEKEDLKEDGEEQFDLEKLLKSSKELSTVSFIATRTLELIESEETDFSEMAAIIESDQALSALVLKVINSPFYSLAKKITEIHRALVFLGFEGTKSLFTGLLSLSLLRPSHSPMAIDRGLFWEHCLAVAILSQNLAVDAGLDNPDELFVHGLLHDVGKTAMNQYLKDDYDQVCLAGIEEKIPLHQVEVHIYGMDHALVGGKLLENWQLPTKLVDSTADHHLPMDKIMAQGDETRKKISMVVAMANQLAKYSLLGYSGNNNLVSIPRQCCQLLGQKRESIITLLESSNRYLQDMKSFVHNFESSEYDSSHYYVKYFDKETDRSQTTILLGNDSSHPLSGVEIMLSALGFSVRILDLRDCQGWFIESGSYDMIILDFSVIVQEERAKLEMEKMAQFVAKIPNLMLINLTSEEAGHFRGAQRITHLGFPMDSFLLIEEIFKMTGQ